MRKVLLIVTVLCMVLGLTSCDSESREITQKYNLPPELKKCRVYILDGDHATPVRALICPHAATSTSWTSGKTTNYFYTDGEVL